MEKWKNIVDFNDYQISNLGRIKSLPKVQIVKSKNQYCEFDMEFKKNEKILKTKVRNGYETVCLINQKKKINKYVHRLVAEAFIPNPNNLPEVNHIDENKSNNCVENLEWCSRKYNNNYGTRGQRISKALNIEIEQYDLNGNFIRRWNSMKEASETLKIRNISQVVNGKRKQAGGFIWKKLGV